MNYFTALYEIFQTKQKIKNLAVIAEDLLWGIRVEQQVNVATGHRRPNPYRSKSIKVNI